MQEQTTLLVNTLHFGEIEVPKDNVIKFQEGLIGFDELKDFIIVTDEESEPFKWLTSIENPAIGFPLIDPWLIIGTYNPGRSFDPNNQVVLSIVTLANTERNMTVNLKAPVFIDIKSNSGKQIILPNDKYSTNHIISVGD